MHLKYIISINLAFIVCLSALMLGMGQQSWLIPFLTLLAAIGGIWLSDIRGTIRLGGRVSNVIVVLLVLIFFGDAVNNRGDMLAVSIARILMLVQIVLLFREKNLRTRWHILLISFLEVIVASVFEQHIFFGILLLVYVFAGLCAVALIFLYQERIYFRNHVFVRPFFQIQRSELSQKQDFRRLLKISLATLVVGPLSLILHYHDPEHEEIKAEEEEDEHRMAQEEADRLADEDLEVLQMPPEALGMQGLENQGIASAEQDTWRGQRRRSSQRWPLFDASPVFSGGAVRLSGMAGVRWELFLRLLWATMVSLLFAALIFVLFPRFRRLELTGLLIGNQWSEQSTEPIRSVGFTDEVRLGSLGEVLENRKKVMSVRYDVAGGEQAYQAVQGNFFYLRGITLNEYEDGNWKRGRPAFDRPGSQLSYRGPPSGSGLIPGALVRSDSDDYGDLRHQPGVDVVDQRFRIEPINTTILFSVWPFFRELGQEEKIRVYPDHFRRPRNTQNNPMDYSLLTTGFRDGKQIELVPCIEPVALDPLLQIPKQSLPALVETARKWEEEADLESTQVVARARLLEERLKDPDRFSYSLGGQMRDLDLDPLEDFIAKNPQGHCEFFAGALAMMLRSRGIPSRVVVGYKSEAYNPMGSEYIVRQCDAHTWVEAYIAPESLPESVRAEPYSRWWEGGGWLLLDATPAADYNLIDAFTGEFTDWKDQIIAIWETYVLHMDPGRQDRSIYGPLKELFSSMKTRMFDLKWWRDVGRMVWNTFRSGWTQLRTGSWFHAEAFILTITVGGLGILLYFFVFRGYRLLRRLMPTASREERRKRASIEFYLRMEALLAKAKIDRPAHQTQREFATASIMRLLYPPLEERKRSSEVRHDREDAKEPLLLATRLIVEAFYRVRFGDRSLEADEIDHIEKALNRIEQAVEGTA